MVWPATIFPIHFFNINHYTACLSPKLCISIVFKFSWEDCKSQEKLETMQTVLLHKFFFGGGEWVGAKQGVLWECESSECPHAHFYVHTPRPPLTKKLLFFLGEAASVPGYRSCASLTSPHPYFTQLPAFILCFSCLFQFSNSIGDACTLTIDLVNRITSLG